MFRFRLRLTDVFGEKKNEDVGGSRRGFLRVMTLCR